MEKERVDRLSSLPRELLEKIISCLPLDDAINTSLISKKLRPRWRNMPDLSLDFRTNRRSSTNKQTVTRDMISKINWVVSNHTGNVKMFKLIIGSHLETDLDISWELDAWFDLLAHVNIEELVIRRFPNKDHLVPSSIFGFAKLTTLSLCKCTLRLLQMFKGFEHLTTLCLDDIKLSGESTDVEIMIQLCPILKHLEIFCFKEPLVLNNVDAPNLETLFISGSLLYLNDEMLPMMLKLVNLYVFKHLTINYDNYSQILNNFWASDLLSLSIFGCSLNLNISNFDKLITLSLMKCEIKPHCMFDCLKFLTVLSIEELTFFQKAYTIESMDCPCLQHLSIGNYSTNCMILKLIAPNLCTLTTSGHPPIWSDTTKNFSPNKTPMITTVVIGFKTLEKEPNFNHQVLARAENLQLIHFTLEHRVLQIHGINKFKRMKIVGFDLSHTFLELFYNDAFVYILRNSPAMENLSISSWREDEEDDEDIGYCIDLFQHNTLGANFAKLKILTMDKAYGTIAEGIFIGYVRCHAPQLEEVNIRVFNTKDCNFTVFKNLFAFKRVSTSKINIIYENE